MKKLTKCWPIVVSVTLLLAVIIWLAILELKCIINYDKTYGCLNIGQFGYPKPVSYHLLLFFGVLSYFVIGIFYLTKNNIWVEYIFKTISLILLAYFIIEAITLGFYIGEFEYYLAENLMLFLLSSLSLFWLLCKFSKRNS